MFAYEFSISMKKILLSNLWAISIQSREFNNEFFFLFK